jgi:hypothetical protein
MESWGMKTMETDGFTISRSLPPRPIMGFKIRRSTLEHLEPLARLAAMAAIADGRWILVEDSEAESENHDR